MHVTKKFDYGFYLPRVRLNIAKNFIIFYGIEL